MNNSHTQSLPMGIVFYSQSYKCTDCTINALNNLMQRPKNQKFTQEMMLALRRTNRRCREVAVAEVGPQGGLFVQWENMLKIILPQCMIVTGTVSDAVEHSTTYGFIANIQQDKEGHINHAVAVVRLKGEFYLFDSLTNGPELLNNTNIKKLSVMVIVQECTSVT